LALLVCALVLPPVLVLLVAAFAHLRQEKVMDATVSAYVLELAESAAYRLNSEIPRWNLPEKPFSADDRYRLFSWGPFMPGWVAYVDNGGEVLLSSNGTTDIQSLWRQNLPVGSAVRVKNEKGHQYTLAVQPLRKGRGYVVAAVSWDLLLGNLVRVGRLWPVLFSVISLISFWAILLLWFRLIAPLRGLASEIDDLRMGKDMPPTLDPRAVKEIDSVHSALMRLARAAIDRDNLRNRYVRDIVLVQEAERLDMAREIHDGPLQDITALLQQIHMSMEEGEDTRDRIKKTERLARVVVRELRGLCDALAPPWVDLGLSQALTELAERLSQNYDIHVSADADDSFDLGPERTLSLLRIFQEAVSNAVRHGDATEVRGQMYEKDGQLVFEIKDNGKGFDAGVDHEALRLEGHRGLANMTERMSLMGGALEVRSSMGEGTTILCHLGRNFSAWENMQSMRSTGR
jgi:signal transduction histidine kinase